MAKKYFWLKLKKDFFEIRLLKNFALSQVEIHIQFLHAIRKPTCSNLYLVTKVRKE